MDLRGLSNTLVKLAGAFILVWAVLGVGNSVTYALQSRAQGVPIWEVALAALFPLLFPAAIGAMLLWFPSLVSNRVIAEISPQPDDPSSFRKIEGVGYAVLAVYLVVTAVRDGVYYYAKLRFYQSFVQAERAYYMPPITPDDFGGMVSTAVQFLLGIALLLGAGGMSRLVTTIRGRT